MLRLLTTKSLDNLLFFLPLLAIHIFLSVSYSLVLHCSNSFEYSTDGVNGSEPLTTFVNPVHDITLFAYQLSNLSSIVTTCKPLSTTFTI